jgi:hypothetical protein
LEELLGLTYESSTSAVLGLLDVGKQSLVRWILGDATAGTTPPLFLFQSNLSRGTSKIFRQNLFCQAPFPTARVEGSHIYPDAE